MNQSTYQPLRLDVSRAEVEAAREQIKPRQPIPPQFYDWGLFRYKSSMALAKEFRKFAHQTPKCNTLNRMLEYYIELLEAGKVTL